MRFFLSLFWFFKPSITNFYWAAHHILSRKPDPEFSTSQICLVYIFIFIKTIAIVDLFVKTCGEQLILYCIVRLFPTQTVGYRVSHRYGDTFELNFLFFKTTYVFQKVRPVLKTLWKNLSDSNFIPQYWGDMQFVLNSWHD